MSSSSNDETCEEWEKIMFVSSGAHRITRPSVTAAMFLGKYAIVRWHTSVLDKQFVTAIVESYPEGHYQCGGCKGWFKCDRLRHAYIARDHLAGGKIVHDGFLCSICADLLYLEDGSQDRLRFCRFMNEEHIWNLRHQAKYACVRKHVRKWKGFVSHQKTKRDVQALCKCLVLSKVTEKQNPYSVIKVLRQYLKIS